MAKKITDHDMTARLREEFFRTGYRNIELSNMIGCHYETINIWMTGRSIPNAAYLAKFYNIGIDVIYILTGERTR